MIRIRNNNNNNNITVVYNNKNNNLKSARSLVCMCGADAAISVIKSTVAEGRWFHGLGHGTGRAGPRPELGKGNGPDRTGP